MTSILNKETALSFVKKHKRVLVVLAALLGILLLTLSFAKDEDGDNVTDLSDYKRRLEGELEDMISSIEGAGKCAVTVSFSDGERYEYRGSKVVSVSPPEVLGVSVVCEGGGSPEVAEQISDAISALFDIGANRVAVLKMKK